jgi:hypothetical protein
LTFLAFIVIFGRGHGTQRQRDLPAIIDAFDLIAFAAFAVLLVVAVII